MTDASVLPYGDRGTAAPRFSRLAVAALIWAIVAPPAMLAAIAATSDTIDEIEPRELLWVVFQTLATAAPLTAVVLGGVAAGRIRARRGELRGVWLAVAAIVIGWVGTVALGWLCGAAATWG